MPPGCLVEVFPDTSSWKDFLGKRLWNHYYIPSSLELPRDLPGGAGGRSQGEGLFCLSWYCIQKYCRWILIVCFHVFVFSFGFVRVGSRFSPETWSSGDDALYLILSLHGSHRWCMKYFWHIPPHTHTHSFSHFILREFRKSLLQFDNDSRGCINQQRLVA